MGTILFFLFGLLETSCILIFNLLDKSAPVEAIFLGYSKERIVLISFLIIVFLLILYLLWDSIRLILKRKSNLERLLQSQNVLWVLIYSSLCISIMILFLFIQESNWLGNYLSLYLKAKPTFVWLLLMSMQTFVFCVFWYSFNFTGIFSNLIVKYHSRDTTILILTFLFFFLLKSFFVLPNGYGLLKDVGESQYFHTIIDLENGSFLNNAYYVTTRAPFLYPIFLLLSLFIKDYSFEVIKILNSIYSTSIIFPIYLISRQFHNRKVSYAIVVISSLIPFQYLLPLRILSENLYFPLLLWVLYFLLVSPQRKFRLPWDILTGILIGGLYLTRFITLALIPIFLLLWWMKPFNEVSGFLLFSKRKFLHVLIIVMMIAVTYSPWVLINIENNLSFKYSLGFGIAAETNPEQLTPSNLFIWTLFYVGYFVLLISPFLNLLFLLTKIRLTENNIKQWFYIIFAVSFGFLIAVIRHSWRARYNVDLPVQIMGRYLIYFLPIYLITSFLSINNFKKVYFKSIQQYIFIGFILPICIVIFSYLLLIKGIFIPIGENFINPLISIDAYYIKMIEPFYFVFIIIFYLASLILIWKPHPQTHIIIPAAFCLFNIVGLFEYINLYKEYQYFQEMGARISNLIISCNREIQNNKEYKIYLPEDILVDSRKDVFWSLAVRNLSSNFSLIQYSDEEIEEILEGNGIIVYPFDKSTLDVSNSKYVLTKKDAYTIELLNCKEIQN